jgi:nucleotidyltransferase substrate binding protein (TIGR01987 family)
LGSEGFFPEREDRPRAAACSNTVGGAEMSLDFSPLEKSLAALECSLQVVAECAAPEGSDLQNTLRAGVVQNFKVAYELSWKMMKRWLEQNAEPDVDGVSRRQLFRLCYENRLIDEVDAWMHFHRSRNETSHTYNQSTAEKVFAVAEPFLREAQKVLLRLQERND